jgi:hypothetical protein
MDAISSGGDAAKDPYMAYLESRGLRKAHVEDFRRRAATYTTPTLRSPL